MARRTDRIPLMIDKLTRKTIRALLEAVATEKIRKGAQRYFKDGIDVIGVKSPDLRPIAREVIKWCRFNGGFPVALKLAEPLWKRGAFEERAIAC